MAIVKNTLKELGNNNRKDEFTMTRFFKVLHSLGPTYYNVAEVSSVESVGIGLRITFNNGDLLNVDKNQKGRVMNEITGARAVVAFAENVELYDVYDDDEDARKKVAERAEIVVLCADGEFRSMDHGDGYTTFKEDDSNYFGLYNNKGLQGIPNLRMGWW